MRYRLLGAALLGCLLLARPAQADYTFEFAENGTFGSSFSVNQGSTITLQVYLAGTNTAGNTNLANNGLQTGGVSLQFATNGPFNIASSSNIVADASWSGQNNSTLTNNGNGAFGSGNTSTGTLNVNNSFANSPTTTDPNGNNAVLLGTFTFTGVSATSGTTLAISSANNPNVDGAGNDLDSLIQSSSASITVNAVPEPGSMILGGLLASGMVGGFLRRRWSAAVAA